MAEAGSTRRTRRSEKAQPITAARSSRTTLMTIRPGEMSSGIEPGGISRVEHAPRATPAMAEAIRVTTTAWTTSPPKIVRDRAPIALSTPYRPMRSTVSSAKNRATTTTAITTVTPMIWLNVARCSLDARESRRWSRSTVSVVGASAGRRIDRGGDDVGRRRRRRVTTRACKTPSASRRRVGWPPAPCATCRDRPTVRPGPCTPVSRHAADHRRPGCGPGRRASPCPISTPSALQHVVGVGLAGGRWVGDAVGCAARSRTGRRSRGRAARCPGPARRAGRRRSRRPRRRRRADSIASRIFGRRCGCGGTRPATTRRVDDRVGVLGADGAGRRADQTVEQSAEEHQQDGDQREDDRGGDESAGPAPQLPEGELHRLTPARSSPRSGRCAAPVERPRAR